MTPATSLAPAFTLRSATRADVEAIGTVWYEGWLDAHLGRVPPALLDHRQPGDFRELAALRVGTTAVATAGSDVVGFVTWHDDEIEQLYVAGPLRGRGVAAALLAHGETAIGAQFDRAWLAVVAGNARARRFYERNGWSDTGPFDYLARTTGEATVPVPVRRYEKPLTTTPDATPAHPGPAAGTPLGTSARTSGPGRR